MPWYKYRALVPKVKAWAKESNTGGYRGTGTNYKNSNRRSTIIRAPACFPMPWYKYRALVPRVKAWAKESNTGGGTEAQVRIIRIVVVV